eukprot:207622_1
MSNSNKRKNEHSPSTGPVLKRHKIDRPRLQFLNEASKSARYHYECTFNIEQPRLIFPDELIEIIVSYCHIQDVYLMRTDGYFKRITDKHTDIYLYDIFIASTGIPDLCVLVQYDAKWFLNTFMAKLNLPPSRQTDNLR